MNSPTHFLMTAALRQALPRIPMVRSAVLIGSIAPDIPFYLLTLGSFLYYQNVVGWPSNETARYIFRTLYFEDPVWIAACSLLHSPVSLAVGLGVARLLRTRWRDFSNWMHWCLMACLLHSLVDIVTHHNDGPVLFWPLNWHYRFPSPISYWDNAHFGRQVGIFEWILDLSLVGYLIFHWRRSKV
ncbi:MAG: metal-dependent hydrolase [Acidobacteria bacterium]|nr:metal-dependent hydrolase [Acidobacteriota bacterium]